jgi:rhamnogalacturonyl hydrolase YesR
MDVSILIGAVIARYCEYSGHYKHRSSADRLINYVVNQQTEYGAWYYTDPPADSHITHDNYHTGFILDALYRYMQATSTYTYEEAYLKGLEYYAKHLFNDNGSPRWMNDRDFPRDIHGSAQGILTFSRHRKQYPDLASNIAEWALHNMYDPKGRFFYQETRYYKKRFTLLRWCNAWMFRGLASLHKSTNL